MQSTRSNVGKQKQEELKQSALRQFAISCQSVYFADQVFIDIATKQLTEMIDERYVAYNNGSHPGSKVMVFIRKLISKRIWNFSCRKLRVLNSLFENTSKILQVEKTGWKHLILNR